MMDWADTEAARLIAIIRQCTAIPEADGDLRDLIAAKLRVIEAGGAMRGTNEVSVLLGHGSTLQ